jgi:hypothetical protein
VPDNLVRCGVDFAVRVDLASFWISFSSVIALAESEGDKEIGGAKQERGQNKSSV